MISVFLPHMSRIDSNPKIDPNPKGGDDVTCCTQAAKLFISRMHSESAAQSSSPGPAAYMKNDTTWKMSSKKKRSPSFGMVVVV